MTHKKITVGILNSDELDPEVEQEFGNYYEMFEKLFISTSLIFKHYQVTQDDFPADLNECDAYLITGSKFSIYDNFPWIIKLSEFILKLYESDIKLIGICFGHQLVAQALGGSTIKSPKGWGLGAITSRVICRKGWMEPPLDSFNLLVTHQDQVEVLPEHAIPLASNDFCRNSGFLLNNILTFQGHPEYSKKYLLYIMNKRREVIGETTYINAQASLNLEIDESIIANWIVNFIKS